MEEKISVVVPIYKVEPYLDRCVNSIVKQTYTNLEIILVNDGSPDNCPKMCDEWEKKDNRIRVIHKENGGLSDARNAGLDKASGDYVLFVDSDDYIELNACERLYGTIKIADSDFVVGASKNIKGDHIEFQKRTTIPENISIEAKEFIISSIDANEWYAPAWLNLYKTCFLKKNMLYFVKGIVHEDIEFLPRLYLSAKRISYCNYMFYNYVIRDNSIMTSKVFDKRREDILKIYEEWKKLFDKVGDTDLKRKLYGVLVKQYLFSCKTLHLSTWLIDGMDYKFSKKYALNIKETMKVFLFNYMPGLYYIL